MSRAIKYQAIQMLKMSELFEQCGSEIISEELIKNAKNLLGKNIKTASTGIYLSAAAEEEYEKIRKNALLEASKYMNNLANDYVVVEENKMQTILTKSGNKVIYSTPLLKMANTLEMLGGALSHGLTATLGALTAKGNFFAKFGKAFAVAEFSRFLDKFVSEINVDSIQQALASAKEYIANNWQQLIGLFAGVALYAWQAKKNPRVKKEQEKEEENRFNNAIPINQQALNLTTAKSIKLIKIATKQNIRNMYKLANELDKIGDYQNATMLDNVAKKLMQYID